MMVTLLWPIGPLEPGAQVDVAQQLGDVLVREGFARKAAAPTEVAEPTAPTLPELREIARKHGCTLTEARQMVAEELHNRRQVAGSPNP